MTTAAMPINPKQFNRIPVPGGGHLTRTQYEQIVRRGVDTDIDMTPLGYTGENGGVDEYLIICYGNLRRVPNTDTDLIVFIDSYWRWPEAPEASASEEVRAKYKRWARDKLRGECRKRLQAPGQIFLD